MPIAFYMDEHVHPAITDGLRLRGIDVLTVQEDGLRGAADLVLLDRATGLGRVIFTQDQDFLAEATICQTGGIPFAGIVYGAQENTTIGQCVLDLEIIAGVFDPIDMADRVEHLPL